MTVSSSVNKVIYSGNSATVLFPVNYYFLENSHLKVILRAADGTETVQALTTNYTVTGAGNPAGGSITMLVAPVTGTTLTIVRNVPATQETDYLANDPFPAESHERALDKLTMLAQENDEFVSRSIQIPQTDSVLTNTIVPKINDRASKLLGFNSIGSVVVSTSTISQIEAAVTAITTIASAPSGNSAGISHIGLGAGAVSTTVQAKLRETVSVQDFGAVGDGLTDDTLAIEAAIQYCSTSKKRLYIPGGKTYLMTEIAINAPYYVDMFSDAANRAVFKTTLAAALASARQFEFLDLTDQVSGLSITQNIIPNQKKIYLNSVSSLSEGMIIRITSNVLWPYDNRGVYPKGEIHLITEVDSGANTVTIEDSTRDTYRTTDTLDIGAWQPNKFAIENLEFEIPEVASTGNTGGVLFDKTYNALIRNCKVSNINNYGFTNRFCVNTSYQKVECSKTQAINLGYGILDLTSLGTHIQNLTSYRLRAAYDSSRTGLHGPNRDAIVDGFVIRGGGVYYPDDVTTANRGLGMHGPSENIQFINGYISDVGNGIRVRGKNTFIRNVTFSGLMITGVACSHGTLMTVSDCTYDSVNYPNKDIVIPTGVVSESRLLDFINFGISDNANNNWDFTLPVMVHNNIIAGLKRSVVNIVSPGEVSNLFLNNNIVQATPDVGDTTLVFYSPSSGRHVYNSTCIGNQLSALSGDIALVDQAASRVLLGYSATAAIKERAVAIDNRSWLVRLDNDTVGKIRTGASEPEQSRLTFILAGDSGGTKSFELRKESTTIDNWYGTSFPTLTATATPSALTGTTGTDGLVTIGVMNNGDFYIQDRQSSVRTWRITLLA